MRHLTLVLALVLGICSPAYAYLDPGTGSIILQGLIAGIAVAGVTIKAYWYKLLSLFGKGRPGTVLEEEEDDTAAPASSGKDPE